MQIQLSPNAKLLQQELIQLIELNQRQLAIPFRLYPRMKEDFQQSFKQYQKKINAATIQIKQQLDYLQKGYIQPNDLLALFQKLITDLRKNLDKIMQLDQIMQAYYAQ